MVYSCGDCFILELVKKKLEYRNLDGSGNNLVNTDYGKINGAILKTVDHDYSNGINELAGPNRPSTREVSNIICKQKTALPNMKNSSNILWLWGQFIDHDIILTKTADERADIPVPQGDPYFDPEATGTQVIPFTRSEPIEGTGVNDVPREMCNFLTPFIDASNVYGTTKERNDFIREFKDGLLKTSWGDMMPVTDNKIHNDGEMFSAIYVGGDPRANEHFGLCSLHTLFVREHNYWAKRIKKLCSDLTDEDIYQTAKIIVESEIESITFNEYLPLLLGKCNIPNYTGYNETVNPQIAHLFSASCYRLHSLIPSLTLDIKLKDQFFASYLMANKKYSIDYVLKCFYTKICEEMDGKFVDDLRNFLFGPPGMGGHDLAAINIQRGRDHCLCDYNSVREKLGFTKKTDFEEISASSITNQQLKDLYNDDIDDVDLYIAGVVEKKYNSHSQLGEVFHVVVKDQFCRIRTGDRLWYENRLSKNQINYINHTKLSDIIKRNTNLCNVPKNVFEIEKENWCCKCKCNCCCKYQPTSYC